MPPASVCLASKEGLIIICIARYLINVRRPHDCSRVFAGLLSHCTRLTVAAKMSLPERTSREGGNVSRGRERLARERTSLSVSRGGPCRRERLATEATGRRLPGAPRDIAASARRRCTVRFAQISSNHDYLCSLRFFVYIFFIS